MAITCSVSNLVVGIDMNKNLQSFVNATYPTLTLHNWSKSWYSGRWKTLCCLMCLLVSFFIFICNLQMMLVYSI